MQPSNVAVPPGARRPSVSPIASPGLQDQDAPTCKTISEAPCPLVPVGVRALVMAPSFRGPLPKSLGLCDRWLVSWVPEQHFRGYVCRDEITSHPSVSSCIFATLPTSWVPNTNVPLALSLSTGTAILVRPGFGRCRLRSS